MNKAADEAFYEIRKQIRRVASLSFDYSHRMKQAYGVTGPQIGMLKYIDYYPRNSVSISEIANGLGSHIASVEGMVKRLHRLKLVRKRKSKKDKRIVEVSLTEKAKQIIQAAPLGVMGNLYYNLQKLPKKKIQQLRKTIDEVVELFDG